MTYPSVTQFETRALEAAQRADETLYAASPAGAKRPRIGRIRLRKQVSDGTVAGGCRS